MPVVQILLEFGEEKISQKHATEIYLHHQEIELDFVWRSFVIKKYKHVIKFCNKLIHHHPSERQFLSIRARSCVIIELFGDVHNDLMRLESMGNLSFYDRYTFYLLVSKNASPWYNSADAIFHLSILIEERPDDCLNYRLRGSHYLDRKSYGKSCKDYKKAYLLGCMSGYDNFISDVCRY